MLTGIIYCEKCGAKYTYIKGSKNSSYAICRNKKIYVKSSEEVSQNIIKFTDKDNDLTSFYSIISTIKGATTYI